MLFLYKMLSNFRLPLRRTEKEHFSVQKVRLRLWKISNGDRKAEHTVKPMPTVAAKEPDENFPRSNWTRSEVFPTPLSPTNIVWKPAKHSSMLLQRALSKCTLLLSTLADYTYPWPLQWLRTWHNHHYMLHYYYMWTESCWHSGSTKVTHMYM